MIDYINKQKALAVFDMLTAPIENTIHTNFIIVSGVYVYEVFTKTMVYKLAIDTRNNQLIESSYNKSNDRDYSFYHNTRSNLTRLLADKFNQFKIETLGY